MDNEFLKSLVKDLADEYTTVAAEGKSSAEFSGTLDTGSFILNAALSGSIYGGVPNNKTTVFVSIYTLLLSRSQILYTRIFIAFM